MMAIKTTMTDAPVRVRSKKDSSANCLQVLVHVQPFVAMELDREKKVVMMVIQSMAMVALLRVQLRVDLSVPTGVSFQLAYRLLCVEMVEWTRAKIVMMEIV